ALRARAAAAVARADVGVVGARRPGRLEGGGRAGGARAGAALGQVALPRGGAAHRAGVPGRVRAGVGAAVALIQGAGVGVGRAGGPGGLLGVGRAGGARAGAGVRDVALTGRGAAPRAPAPRRMRARGRPHGTVAHVGRAHVAVVGAARARRLDRIGGTARALGREREELADVGGVAGRGLLPGRAGGRLGRV